MSTNIISLIANKSQYTYILIKLKRFNLRALSIFISHTHTTSDWSKIKFFIFINVQLRLESGWPTPSGKWSFNSSYFSCIYADAVITISPIDKYLYIILNNNNNIQVQVHIHIYYGFCANFPADVRTIFILRKYNILNRTR